MGINIKRFWYSSILKKNPASMPMVSYWKFKEAVQAKITKDKDGSVIMKLEGEKYPIRGFPRGHILYGHLSKLKHEIKNQIFNESWWRLEKGEPRREVIKNVKKKLFNEIADLAALSRYDMVPFNRMCHPVREIHRAWTKVAPERTYPLRDYFCFILQEDDGYRMRVQWIVKYFNPNSWWFRLLNPVRMFEKALCMLEHAEVVGDMKERIRLLRRILLLCLEDKTIKDLFEKFCKEIDWNKIKLSEGDKYHFRGKYFKVDYDFLEY